MKSSWLNRRLDEIRTIAHERSNKTGNRCRGFAVEQLAGRGRPAQSFTQNEKATRQLGQPFLSRENSSNGDQTVKTFWRNLMSLKRGVSRNISEINSFIFSDLQNRLIVPLGCSL